MSKPLLAGLSAAAALHVACGVFLSEPVARTGAVVAIDLALAAYVFFYARKARGGRDGLGVSDAGSVPAAGGVQTSKAESAPSAVRAEYDNGGAVSAPSSSLVLTTFPPPSRADRDNGNVSNDSPDFSVCDEMLRALLDETTRRRAARERLSQIRDSLASLHEATEAIRQNAQQVTGIADSLSSSSEQGFALSENVQKHTENLSVEIGGSMKQTAELLEESRKISDIITIMSEISATTNVLSINASIVAARAGAKGREFDVVAKEVRKLSVGTEESLKNISTLVASIQEHIRSVSGRLETIGAGILKENDSMLSVGGALQGISLATEIVRSVTTVSGDRARDSSADLKATEALLEQALEEFTNDDTERKIHELRGHLDSFRAALAITEG